MINNVGVPSVGKIIQILPSSAPEVVMVCPASGGFVQPGSINVSAKVKETNGVARVIAGNFTKLKSTSAAQPRTLNWIGRLMPEAGLYGHLPGDLDGGWFHYPTHGPDGMVKSLATDADGLFVIVEGFTHYAVDLTPDPTRNGIARIGGL